MWARDISLGDLPIIYNEFPENFLWNIFYDVQKPLIFLHSQQFFHFDVKPANLMKKSSLILV